MNGLHGPRLRPVLRQSTRATALVGGLVTLATPRPSAAQVPAAQVPAVPTTAGLAFEGANGLATIGSPADERARVRQLLGDTTSAGFLIRTPTLFVPADATGRESSLRAWVLLPEATVASNSALPSASNDGALWAGRGVSLLVRGGLAARAGRVVLVFAPELTYAQNRGFQTIASGLTGQAPATGPYQAPWYTGAYSVDLPLRFGDQPYATLGLGQSALTVDLGRVAVGVSGENQWWGPGARNALVMSNAAAGVPHAFVRTARPLRTWLGDVEARVILGTLTSSLYFTPPQPTSAEYRALSGAVVTFRPAAARALTVGAERLVLTPVRAAGAELGHALDVFYRNANLGTGDSLRRPSSSDQIAGVFARYVVPSVGTEVYGELTRSELPRTLRDLLLAPLNTGAYTLGVAHAARLRQASSVAVRVEFTNLEQTRTYTDRPPPPDYYTGRAAPAGFTNRGQGLGAAIGPGSQSQFVGVDYYEPRWQLGAFAERVRNQNDALSRVFGTGLFHHDVTIGGGLRGGVRLPYLDARAELTANNRVNYLFQNGRANLFAIGTVDVSNYGLTLSLSPRLPHASP